MAVGFAFGDEDDYPWGVRIRPDEVETGYSVTLVDLESTNKALYYHASVKTPDKDLEVRFRECGFGLDDLPNEFREEFDAHFPNYDGMADPRFVDGGEPWNNFQAECYGILESNGRDWFQRAPFEMMLTYVTDGCAMYRGRISVSNRD